MVSPRGYKVETKISSVRKVNNLFMKYSIPVPVRILVAQVEEVK